MRGVVPVAMGHDQRRNIGGRFAAERHKALYQLPVGEPRIDQDTGRRRFDEQRIALAPASQDRYPHEQPRAQLRSIGKTLGLRPCPEGARVAAWTTAIWNTTA